jgi:hypothetical protein
VCKYCGKCFEDADGTKEIFPYDSPNLNSDWMIWVLITVGILIFAGAGTFLLLRFKFGFFQGRKAQYEESAGKSTETPEIVKNDND